MDAIKFYINRNSHDDLHLQLKKQIEYRIATGELKVGDRLPPIRDLEKKLKINRHTIRRAYLSLEREGLLSVRRGIGVTVTTELFQGNIGHEDAAVHKFADLALAKALEMDVSPLVFAKLLNKKAFELDRKNPTVAFVECSDHQAGELASVLEAFLGQAVLGIDLSALIKDKDAVPACVKYVVVPVFHSHEVADMLQERNLSVLTVHLELGQQFKAQSNKHMPVQHPCVILSERESLPWFPEVMKKLLHLDTEITPLSVLDPMTKVGETVKQSDLVFFSPPCKEFAEKIVPPGKKKQEILFEFPLEVLDKVKRWLA